MTIQNPLSAFSEVVDERRRWTPDWYSWLADLVRQFIDLSLRTLRITTDYGTSQQPITVSVPSYQSTLVGVTKGIVDLRIVDQSNVDLTGNTSCGIFLDYIYGGGTIAQGSHVGASFNATFGGAGATAPGDTGALFGGWIQGQSNANWGGTLGSEKGSVWGLNVAALLASTATHMIGVTGQELDVACFAGSSVQYKFGLGIVLTDGDAVQGSNIDFALGFGAAQAASPGWKVGISFNSEGVTVISPSGTMISTRGTQTVAHGIDFSGWTFSSDFLKGAGWSIDGNGNIHMNMGTLVNAASDAAAAGAGVPIGQVYRNGSVLQVRVV